MGRKNRWVERSPSKLESLRLLEEMGYNNYHKNLLCVHYAGFRWQMEKQYGVRELEIVAAVVYDGHRKHYDNVNWLKILRDQVDIDKEFEEETLAGLKAQRSYGPGKCAKCGSPYTAISPRTGGLVCFDCDWREKE